MTDTKNIPLEIEPVNPGFIVREGAGFNPGGYRPALFACTTIGEALGFIRSRLAPVGTVPGLGTLVGGQRIGTTISDPGSTHAIPAFTHTFSGGGDWKGS